MPEAYVITDIFLTEMKAVRNELWNKNRSPQGREEQERYDLAHRINDALNALGKTRAIRP